MQYRVLISVGLAVVLASCEHKSDVRENRMKRRAIVDQLLDNTYTFESLTEQGRKSSSPTVRAVLEQCNELAASRERFQSENTISSLLSFADTVARRYRLLHEKNDQISEAIRTYRERTLENEDSTSVLNLTWHALYAEKAILDITAIA